VNRNGPMEEPQSLRKCRKRVEKANALKRMKSRNPTRKGVQNFRTFDLARIAKREWKILALVSRVGGGGSKFRRRKRTQCF